jgi:hypothetical protein
MDSQPEWGASLGAAWRWWKILAKKAANIQARVFLTLFYFTVIAPVGLIARIASDPLRIKRVGATPAWQARDTRTPDIAESRRLY